MSSSKHFDRVCAVVLCIAILVTVLFMNGTSLGLQTMVDEDAETYTGDAYFTANDLNGTWDTASATVIHLESDAASIRGNGAYFSGGALTIKNGGTYVVDGVLENGSIIVDAYKSSKVWILLNGVSVSCGNDAALQVRKADKVFITLAADTENTFASGETYSEDALENNRNAAVWSKEDLTVNGSGALTVTAGYKHGIKCSDELVIAGGTLTVTCPQDGLHANDSIRMTGADVTIDAGDDAIHCDTEIYYRDGDLLITSCYEGIEAPQIEIAGGTIEIHATDDGINANGGPEESFGMQGMGGMFDAQETEEQTTEDEELPLVHITGGSITILNENGNDADGIDSNGDILIEGGQVLVSLTDTGMNSALDYGSENGGGLFLNGGTVVAAGSSGMLEEVSAESLQCSMTLVLGSSQEAGTTLTVTDAAGETVLEQEIPYSYSALIVTSPLFAEGGTYAVQAGDGDAREITFDTRTVTSGTAAGGGFGGGGFGGGFSRMQDGEWPERPEEMSEGEPGYDQMQNGERPQMPEGMSEGDFSQMPEGMTEGEFPQMPEGMSEGDFSQMPEAMTERDFSQLQGGGPGMPEEAHDDTLDEENTDNKKALSEFGADTWRLLGASGAVLLAGLLAALLYRRRR